MTDSGTAPPPSQEETRTSPTLLPQFPDPLPGVIPFGSLSIFMGPPKRGKTAVLAEWCARWRDGRPICGLPTNSPTGLGIFTTDHKWHLNQQGWFAKAGFPEIRHYSLRDELTIQWRQLRIPHKADEILNRALDTLNLPPGSLILIDVIGPFITSKLNDYAEVVGGLGTISQIMDRRQLTCLAVSHMAKQKGDVKDRYKDPFERILGSGAQIGFSDTMFYLLGPQDLDQPYYEVGWQPTHSPSGTFRFKRDAFGLFVPHDEQDAKPLSVNAYEAPIGVDAVLAKMPTAEPAWHTLVLLDALQTECQVKRRRAEELATALLRDGRIRRIKQGWYLRVPPS